MKKILYLILAFLLTQPGFCLAQGPSGSSIFSSESEDNVNLPINIVSENGTTVNYIADVKLLLNRVVTLKKGKKEEILKECIFKDTNGEKNNYDLATTLVTIACNSQDDFKAYINCMDDMDTLHSNDGELSFYLPSEEVFSVDLKSNQADLYCDLGVLGIGVNSSAKKIFPMELTCGFSESASTRNIISPFIKSLAPIALLLFG